MAGPERSPDDQNSVETPTVGRGRSLGAMRFVVALAMMAAVASAAAHLTVSTGIAAVGIEVPALAATGILVQVALYRSDRGVRRQREEMLRAWHEQHAELHELATRDDLTQLQNRRFFYGRLQEELATAVSGKMPLSILMIDVDDLKAVNDEFGHQVGDVVLRSLGRLLNEQAGQQNVTARLGGDEFAVIMPGADRRDADQMAWRLWEELSRAPICETDHASIYLGVSVGTSGFPWGGKDLEEIIHWADTKLYANKLERKGFKQLRDPKKDTRLVSAIVDVLASALDVRDRMTHRHARRVARMAAWVAREMALSEGEVIHVEYAAALHDIGKIGVADNILRKAGSLDEDEWREMRRHSELGYEILNGIDFLHEAAEIVYAHHERYDGTGYPRRLAGTEMPLGARVFAVVDAYDAMISRRPYRDAIPRESALMEIARNAGTQFDPQVVEAFLVMVRRDPDGFRGEEDDYGARIESLATPAGATVNGNGQGRLPSPVRH